jgi:putative Ca2+/H+ antiporter (TMEM165/GDT1 family)
MYRNLQAFLLIFFSEIGDKTFFIAALLATRKSNLAVFTGTFGALATMTVISVTLGRAFHYLDGVLPFSLGNMELPLDDLAAVVLLVYFGVSTLLEASSMDGSKAEEEQQEVFLEFWFCSSFWLLVIQRSKKELFSPLLEY